MKRLLLLTLSSIALVASSARPAHAECGDLLIVLDRSGSMVDCKIGGKTKEAIAKEALAAMVMKYATTPMGIAVFPDTIASCPGIFGSGGDSCPPGKVYVDIAADGAYKVGTWLAGMPSSCGGTPTGDTMNIIAGYSKWSPKKDHYVLLLTDGQPTCQDGDDGAASPVMCDGKGMKECANPTKVFDAIKALYEKPESVHTFVVGFEGMGTGSCNGMSGGPPFNPATLDHMAEVGGEANTTGATKYYSATDGPSLMAALEKILGKVSGATVGGCAADGGAGGSGGAGGAGGGGGGAPPSDAGAQDGGQDGGGGHGMRGDAGCACTTTSGAPGFGALVSALLAVAMSRRRWL